MDAPGGGQGADGGPFPRRSDANDWGEGRMLGSGEVVGARSGNADDVDPDASALRQGRSPFKVASDSGDEEEQNEQEAALESSHKAYDEQQQEQQAAEAAPPHAEELQCRICRSGEEDDTPLFRPCKCSGSIQYCHQDCLIEWLSHSRKKYCELCGHSFAFKKRYKSSLPKGLNVRWTPPFRLPLWMLPADAEANPPTFAFQLPLPAYLYVRRMALQALGWVFTGFRGITVLLTWLVLLPLVNISVWRNYFWVSDTIVAAWESIVSQPIVPKQIPAAAKAAAGATTATVHAALNAAQPTAVTLLDFLSDSTEANASQAASPDLNGTFASQIAVPFRAEFFPVFRSIMSFCNPAPTEPISPLYRYLVANHTQPDFTPLRTFTYSARSLRFQVDITRFCALLEQSDIMRRIARLRPSFNDPFSFRLARLFARTVKTTIYLTKTCSAAGPKVCTSAMWKWLKRWTSVMSTDLVEGQILTCAIIITFVGVFLLREWVLQNLPQVAERLEEELDIVQGENDVLEAQIAEAERETELHRQEGATLAQQTAQLQQEIAELRRQNAELVQENAEQRERIIEAFRAAAAERGDGTMPFDPSLLNDVDGSEVLLEAYREAAERHGFGLPPEVAERLQHTGRRRDGAHEASASQDHEEPGKDASVANGHSSSMHEDAPSNSDALAADGSSATHGHDHEAVRTPTRAAFESDSQSQPVAGPSKGRVQDKRPDSPSSPSQNASASDMREAENGSADELLRTPQFGSRFDSGSHHPPLDTPAIIQGYRTREMSGMFDDAHDADTSVPSGRSFPFTADQQHTLDGEEIDRDHNAERAPLPDWEQVQEEPQPDFEPEPEAAHEPLRRGADFIGDQAGDEEDEDDDDDADEEEEDFEDVDELVRDQLGVEAAEIAARLRPAGIGGEIAANGDDVEQDALIAAGVELGLGDAGMAGWEEGEQMAALDEELDGMLEAIGMRGPMVGLFQNAALMVVLCSFALMLFVAVPYVAGRTFGFGTSLVRLAAVPINFVRLVTDPTFDTLIDWIDRFVLKRLAAILAFLPKPQSLSSQLSKAVSSPVALPSVISTAAAPGLPTNGSLSASALWLSTSRYMHLLEDVQTQLFDFGEHINAKTRGTSVSDRVLCILLGHSYCLAALVLDSYFGWFQGSQQLQWLRQFIDFQRYIVKVLFFMIVELLVFPIGCGLVLDLCVAPLLENVRLAGRLSEAMNFPFTFFFVRWVGGTLYMFGFAQWVGSTRKLLRRGVLSWIRDPNDPNFSPVREILERKTSVQLKKIFSSGIMYTWLLMACVGVNTWFIYLVIPGIFPLRWRPFQPLSTVPFDLLVLYYAMPLCIRLVKPGSLMRRLSRKWWAQVAHQLRLSNFLLGKVAPLEQGRVEYSSWTARLLRRGPYKATDLSRGRPPSTQTQTLVVAHADIPEHEAQHEAPEAAPEAAAADGPAPSAGPESTNVLEGPGWKFVPDGDFARVPADDSPATNSRMFIMVDREGVPINEEEARALDRQERAIERMTKKPRYEVVYLPPKFRVRMYSLLFLFWITVSFVVQISLVAPLVFGRWIFAIFTSEIQHDVYAWSIGCPLLAVPAALVYQLYRDQRRRIRRRWQRQQHNMMMAQEMQRQQQAPQRRQQDREEGDHQQQQQQQQNHQHDAPNEQREQAPNDGAPLHAAQEPVRVQGPLERVPAAWPQKLRAGVKQGLTLVYFALTLGVAIPFLLGMTVRVYLVEPWLDVRQLAKPVPVFQTWAMGLMEQALLVRVIALQNDGWAQVLTSAIDRTVRNGLGRNMQPWRTTKGVIVPVLSALVLLLTAPPLQVGLNFALRAGPPLTPTLQQTAVRAAYKWFSFGLMTAKVLRMIVVRIDQWTMALKDELFLESTELTNYRPEEDGGGVGRRGGLMGRRGRALAAGADAVNPDGGGVGDGHNGRGGGEEEDDGLAAVGPLPDRFL